MKRIIGIAAAAIPRNAAITIDSIQTEMAGIFLWSTLACVALFAFGQADAAALTGKVVGVSDGDTITVFDANHQQLKIRLSGIDAPEKKQPFGQRSKQHLSDLVFSREVDVIWHKHDRYRRIVGQVIVAHQPCLTATCQKTTDAGLSQIDAGMAWWYRKYAHEQPTEKAAAYERAEALSVTRSECQNSEVSSSQPSGHPCLSLLRKEL